MEIKDLAGIGGPLEKLVETMSRGVGRLSAAYFARKDADAEAYRIKAIAQAVADTKATGAVAGFNDGKLTIAPPRPAIIEPEPPDPAKALPARVQRRLQYQQERKQLNIENVTTVAAEQLKHEQEVSSDPVSDDWTARFFSSVEDVSNEQMQALWGKILAGEVKQPGSFSFRTLDLVRNLSDDEARLFEKVGSLAIKTHKRPVAYLWNTEEGRNLNSAAGVSYDDVLMLSQAGLIIESSLIWTSTFPSRSRGTVDFGSRIVVLENLSEAKLVLQLDVLLFTAAGVQLLSLLHRDPPLDYISKFANAFAQPGITAKCFPVVRRKPTGEPVYDLMQGQVIYPLSNDTAPAAKEEQVTKRVT